MWLICNKLISALSVERNIRTICSHIFSMDTAYLRHSKGTEQFDITFHYTNQELRVDRRFNFSRNLNESVNIFLTRVCGNLEKVANKKSKKRKSAQESDNGINIDVCLLLDEKIVEGATACKEVFTIGNNVILKLMDQSYRVLINSPFIESIALPNSMLANFPVYPIKFNAVYTNKKLCEFTWYVSKDLKNWNKVGTGFLYTPRNTDIGCYIKLCCVPRNEQDAGPIIETISAVTVDASPGLCPFENRHKYTTERCCNNEFRVVTYNILADLYCDQEFTRTVLHPYCPPYALNIDYRKQLTIKELMGYNGDIICLQEVDKKVYTYDLEPIFSMLDYDSNFVLKGKQVAEGLACLYNKRRFEFLEDDSIVFAEVLDSNPVFSDIVAKISQNTQLKEHILTLSTVLHINVLKNLDTGNILLVANTHLYFHPDADNIRLVQAALFMRYVTRVYETTKEKYKTDNIAIVFCGDFNSSPDCGIYQLYTTGHVPADFKDFKSNKDEIITDLELNQPFKFSSACGTPQYTNFTAGFQDCLDYIFYDSTKLSFVKMTPLPTIEELHENTAIPSVVFPSDHISLVADLKFL